MSPIFRSNACWGRMALFEGETVVQSFVYIRLYECTNGRQSILSSSLHYIRTYVRMYVGTTYVHNDVSIKMTITKDDYRNGLHRDDSKRTTPDDSKRTVPYHNMS